MKRLLTIHILGFWMMGMFALSASMSHAQTSYSHDSLVITGPNAATLYSKYCLQLKEEIPPRLPITMLSWFEKLPKAEVKVFDRHGTVLQSLDRKDLVYMQYMSSYAIYEDNDMYFVDLSALRPPCWITVETEVNLSALFVLPAWRPSPFNEGTMGPSSFVVRHPADLPIKYYLRPGINAKVVNEPGYLKLALDSLPMIKTEDAGPTASSLRTLARFKVDQWKVDGIPANTSSWKGLGTWHFQLMRGLDSLDADLRAMAASFQKQFPDPRARAQAIYNHVQQTKRYVSIQKGIGGMKPFSVAEVEAKGYGDCKALSLYTATLLRRAGIEAHCALIKAGPQEQDIITAFPAIQFNHMVVCMPNQGDTIWLECTSQDNPFGYMGSFTEGRHALLITPQGGVLAYVPRREENTNLRTVSGTFQLDSAATRWQGHLRATYQYAWMQEGAEYLNTTGDALKKAWMDANALTGLDVHSISAQAGGVAKGSATVSCSLSVREGLQKTTKRVMFKVNFLSPLSPPVKPTASRLMPFLIEDNLSQVDSIRLILPAHLLKASIPAVQEVHESPFGTYSLRTTQETDAIRVVRKLVWRGGWYDPSQWTAYTEFYKKISKADATMLILEKPSTP